MLMCNNNKQVKCTKTYSYIDKDKFFTKLDINTILYSVNDLDLFIRNLLGVGGKNEC